MEKYKLTACILAITAIITGCGQTAPGTDAPVTEEADAETGTADGKLP